MSWMFYSFLSTGTTWMQEMVTLISNRGDPHLSQTVPNWARAPWLEQHYFAAVLEASSITPRVITTHLPHHLLSLTLQSSKPKVIYIYKCRQLFRPQSKFYVEIEQINWPGQYTGCD